MAAASSDQIAPPVSPVARAGNTAAADPVLARLQDRIRAAQADGHALRIRGSGSKDFYGGRLDGALLETRELCGISSYEPSEMVVTVRTGTPLVELAAALAEKGQCLAFEPPAFGPGATVGGMLAAGLAGPARASVGGVRDFVLGLTLLNGRAELLQFGGQVMKNVAGYDVSRVMAGSLGILGLVCEVSLKVPPLPAAQASLVLEADQAGALAWLHRWTAQARPVNASAWHDGLLHLRLAGAAAAVEASVRSLVQQEGARVLEPLAAQAYWSALREQQAAFFTRPDADSRLWRLSVPATTAPLELPLAQLVEWGGAQRWLWSAEDADTVRARANRVGGYACCFRGAAQPLSQAQAGLAADERAGSTSASGLPGGIDFLAPLSPALERVHRALKASFDPAGIFNPGRLYPWL